MSVANPQSPVGEPARTRRSPFPEQATGGHRPAWAEFAIQEALRVTDEDVPADLAERHDDYLRVAGERFLDPVLLHDYEGQAVGEAPRLVPAAFVTVHRFLE